jgi:hypothetical protein
MKIAADCECVRKDDDSYSLVLTFSGLPTEALAYRLAGELRDLTCTACINVMKNATGRERGEVVQ